MTSAEAKQRYVVLAAEYERVSATILAQESQSDKILNIGVTIISLSAAAGVAQKVYGVFFLVPVAIVTITLYTLMTYFYIQSLAGYKRHIEALINEYVGQQLLIWERIVMRREKHNLVRKTLLVSYAIIAFGLIGASAYYIFWHFGRWPMIGLGAVLSSFVPFLFLSARDLAKVNNDTYALSTHLFSQSSPV